MLPERAVDLNAGLAITVLACLNCGRRKAADAEPRPITSRHWPVATINPRRALTCDEQKVAALLHLGPDVHLGHQLVHIAQQASLRLSLAKA